MTTVTPRDPLDKSREPARHGTGCRTRRHLLSIAALLTANGNAVMRPLRGCDGRGDLFRGSLMYSDKLTERQDDYHPPICDGRATRSQRSCKRCSPDRMIYFQPRGNLLHVNTGQQPACPSIVKSHCPAARCQQGRRPPPQHRRCVCGLWDHGPRASDCSLQLSPDRSCPARRAHGRPRPRPAAAPDGRRTASPPGGHLPWPPRSLPPTASRCR